MYKWSKSNDQDGDHAYTLYEPRNEKTFVYAKTKMQISFAVAAKLISAFVFAALIVQSLYFLCRNFKPLAIFCGSTAWFASDLVGHPETSFLTTQLIYGPAGPAHMVACLGLCLGVCRLISLGPAHSCCHLYKLLLTLTVIHLLNIEAEPNTEMVNHLFKIDAAEP